MVVYAVREYDKDKLFDSFEKAKNFALTIINRDKNWYDSYNDGSITKIIDRKDKIILKVIYKDRIYCTVQRTIRKKEIEIN